MIETAHPDSSRLRGLTHAEVIASRQAHGINVLTPPAKESLWLGFIRKFKDPLIIILLIAGAASIGISCYEYYGLGKGISVFFEPLGIFIAILLATGLAFIFELKADREFELLNQVNDDTSVQVIRDGHPASIARRDVVVGDIVILETGQEIPADGRLLETVSLNVDESSLTGEPICHKSVDPADSDPEATFPTDMALRGTKVMEGHGVMVVTAVGDATENGKVYEAACIDDSVKTPLNEQLEGLSRLITKVSYAIGLLIVGGRMIQYYISVNGVFDFVDLMTFLLQTVMIAVTLVVVAVPEGLPMAVTLSLAYSMRRMLKTKNLVRRMHACETMGAATVICTDKTGTLTQNRMAVYAFDLFGNPDRKRLYESVAVNSTAQLDRSVSSPVVLGNPTEGALLLWLDSQGEQYESLREGVTRVAELPFSTERKYMATAVRDADGSVWLYVKGAPEIVLDLCATIGGGMSRERIREQLLEYQNRGMRTLSVAWQQLPDGVEADTLFADGSIHAGELELVGIVAISDPVRPDVPDAVREALDAGIDVKIVTGDTPATAREIGRQTGLWDDAVDGAESIITGPEFGALSDAALSERVQRLKIIARARPMDKKRLVEALQAKGHVVAVTGDGTNDAPALKAAHVGLSMGDGTSVAKEASDITIIDNSFSGIGRAVMWGRSLYRNIQRFILFQMTVNVAASLIVLCGAFLGTDTPLTVTQMLWVNLIMDTFAAMALASLPPDRSVMRHKPRKRTDFIIPRRMGYDIFGTGMLFFVLLLGLLLMFEHSDITCLTDLAHFSWGADQGLTPYELSLFFTIFVFLQFWNIFNARAYSTGRSAFRLKGCKAFVGIATAIFVGQIAIVTFGGDFFNVVPLRLTDWIIIIAATSPVLWIPEVWRLLRDTKTVDIKH